MIGLSDELVRKLYGRGLTDEDITRMIDSRAWKGELRFRYRRGDDTVTTPLPSSRHLSYVSRGWVACDVEDIPAPTPRREPTELPAQIAEYAKGDRAGLYRRDDRESIQSTRRHAALEAEGWTFVRLATERELYISSRHGRTLSEAEAVTAAALPHVVEAAKPAKK